jgi:hypothetical protein
MIKKNLDEMRRIENRINNFLLSLNNVKEFKDHQRIYGAKRIKIKDHQNKSNSLIK